MPGVRDIILTVCSAAFGYALVPQVIYGFRGKVGAVTIQTSVVTGGALFGSSSGRRPATFQTGDPLAKCRSPGGNSHRD